MRPIINSQQTDLNERLDAAAENTSSDTQANLLFTESELLDLTGLPRARPEDFDLDPPVDTVTLSALASNSENAAVLHDIQRQAQDGFTALVNEVCEQLRLAELPPSAATPLDPPMDIRALMTASRKGEKTAKMRRDLAEAISIGSLLNPDNPDWAETAASTDLSAQDSLLLALLRMPVSQT